MVKWPGYFSRTSLAEPVSDWSAFCLSFRARSTNSSGVYLSSWATFTVAPGAWENAGKPLNTQSDIANAIRSITIIGLTSVGFSECLASLVLLTLSLHKDTDVAGHQPRL